MKKTIGYILLFLSVVAWGVILLLPFIELSTAQIAAATTFLIVVGEILFWGAIVLLGKEVWEKIKSRFKRRSDK